MILVGDIGGTKSSLGIFDESDPLSLKKDETYFNKNYPEIGLEGIIKAFLNQIDAKEIKAACFGVAGSVKKGRCQLTNLNWTITEEGISKLLNNIPVILINDLEAIGLGISSLSSGQLINLNPNKNINIVNSSSPKAVLAAGTGLGQIGLCRKSDKIELETFPSEGGHVDFAPRNQMEIELLTYLLKREKFYGHVSYERVLSGIGLFNIYQFLRDSNKYGSESIEVKDRLNGLESNQVAPVISEFALEKKDDLCVRALDMFVSIYGAKAGNLALTYSAFGGIFLGGGIAPKIIDKLKDGTFIAAFKDKGSFSQFVENIPVVVIMEPRIGLWGAISKVISRKDYTIA